MYLYGQTIPIVKKYMTM